MHMPSEVVGPVMSAAGFAAAAAAVGYCGHRLRQAERPRLVPLLAVLSAFVFAAQMVNFPVGPSSGHLGGGVLLATLLGPEAAVLGMAAVLTIQCFLFADGGLLALGLNIFNMGVVPAVVFAGVNRLLPGGAARRIGSAAVAAWLAVVAGAFLVPFEVSYSKVNMPFWTFLSFMLFVHALIGIGEAAITAGAASVLLKARLGAFGAEEAAPGPLPVVAGVLLVAVFVAAVLSNFASSLPDGLEASLAQAPEAVAGAPAAKTAAPLPDYVVPGVEDERVSTGLAGFIGTLVTFAATLAVFKALAARRKREPHVL